MCERGGRGCAHACEPRVTGWGGERTCRCRRGLPLPGASFTRGFSSLGIERFRPLLHEEEEHVRGSQHAVELLNHHSVSA